MLYCRALKLRGIVVYLGLRFLHSSIAWIRLDSFRQRGMARPFRPSWPSRSIRSVRLVLAHRAKTLTSRMVGEVFVGVPWERASAQTRAGTDLESSTSTANACSSLDATGRNTSTSP